MDWNASHGGADRVRGGQVAAQGSVGRKAAGHFVRGPATRFFGVGFVLCIAVLSGKGAGLWGD